MKQKDFKSPLTEIQFLNECLYKNISHRNIEIVKFKYQLLENISNEHIHQPDDDELMFFCIVPQDIINNIGLDVFIDENKMYIRDKHPLWVYVQNGQSSDEYVAFTVSKQPKIANGITKLNLSNEELANIRHFIITYKNLIEQIANGQIRSYKAFKEIIDNVQPLQMVESKHLLNEMSVIGKEDTGLTVDIWLEFIRTPKQHSLYRFKFQAEQGETNTRNWSTIIFGNTPVEVINMPKKTFLKGNYSANQLNNSC